MKIKNLQLAIAQGTIVLAVLSGCGGGGDDESSAATNTQTPTGINATRNSVQTDLVAASADVSAPIALQEAPAPQLQAMVVPATGAITTEELAASQLAAAQFGTGEIATQELLPEQIAAAALYRVADDEPSTEEFATFNDPAQETPPGEFPVGQVRAPVSLDQWATFYNTKYKAHAAVRVPYLLERYYSSYRLNDNPSLPALSLADIKGSQDTMTRAYINLSNDYRTKFASAVKALIRSDAANGLAPFTLLELDKYLEGLLAHSIAQVNFWLQYEPRTRAHVEAFFASASHSDQARRFLALRAEAERTDDERYLQGANDDAVEESSVWVGKPELKIKLGHKRAPIERAELKSSRSIFTYYIFPVAFTEESVKLHGINSTKIEPSVGSRYIGSKGREESDAYVLDASQNATLDYYVNKDVAENKALPGLDVNQTKRHLRGASEFIARETGLTYEAYVAAQFALRAASQLITAATRVAIDNKTINLKLIAEQTVNTVTNDISITSSLTGQQQALLRRAVESLVAITVGQGALTIVFLKATHNAYEEGKATKTDAQIEAEALLKMRKFIGAAQSSATMLSLGILGGFSYAPTQFRPTIQYWIPAGFAISDLTAGITALVSTIKTGKYNTGAGMVDVSAAVIRTFGALYTLEDTYGYKCFSKTVLYKLGWNSLTPIRTTSYTALISAGLYMLGTAFAITGG